MTICIDKVYFVTTHVLMRLLFIIKVTFQSKLMDQLRLISNEKITPTDVTSRLCL